MKITRTNIVKLDFTGSVTIGKCIICGEITKIKQSAEFKPYREMHNGKSYTVKTNKHQLKNFIEYHFGKHFGAQKKNAR